MDISYQLTSEKSLQRIKSVWFQQYNIMIGWIYDTEKNRCLLLMQNE